MKKNIQVNNIIINCLHLRKWIVSCEWIKQQQTNKTKRARRKKKKKYNEIKRR